MSIKIKALSFVAEFISKSLKILFNERRRTQLQAFFIERFTPVESQRTKYGKIDFYCPTVISSWRAETMLSKEPETIEWIESFKEDETLWDIGANIGTYTLYAAKRNIKTIAFEPSAYNYYLLTKNIEINNLSESVSAYCIAFSNDETIGLLNMTITDPGGAISEFGRQIDKVEVIKKSIDVIFRQGMLGFSIDKFIDFFKISIPNHIKIDVDGIEDKIIAGAKNTLRNSELKSLLIELDENQAEYTQNVIYLMESSGMKLKEKKHSAMVENSEWSSVYNYIFARS